MKSIRSLILIAIGMIAFTATATTAKLEQKQKTEFVKDYTLTNEVSVVKEYQVVSVYADATNFINVINFTPSKAIVTDVGLQKDANLKTITFYKKKQYQYLFSNQIPIRYCRSNC